MPTLLTKALPILTWAPRYRRADLGGDLAAGLTVAAMLVPQAMAYALLAGLPPEAGLYAATVPLVLYAIFGTSRQLAVGPVAIVSLLTASALAGVAEQGTAEYLEAAAVLALLVGVVSAVLGLARLGFLTNLLSHPVLVGYTAAAAIIIGFSQAKHLFGIKPEKGESFYEEVRAFIDAIDGAKAATMAIAAASIVALVLLKRFVPKVPAALAVVVASILAVKGLGLADEVAVVGEIPSGLPPIAIPGLDGELVGKLAPTAVIIALVGFLESIAVAKVYARRDRYEVEPNQELVGLGAANLGAGIFGGYPVTGGFSRTAVNAHAGARTPLASLLTATIMAVTLVALTPLFHDLPQATLGAIVIVAVAGLFDVAEARHIHRVKPTDTIPLVVAFAATLVVGIELGILVAAGLSLALIVVRMSRPHTAVLGRIPDSHVFRNVERYPDVEVTDDVAVLRVDVSLSYLNSTFLKRRIAQLRADHPGGLRAVVLDCSGVNDLDSSAEHTLHEVDDELRAAGIELHLAAVKGPVRDVLDRSGFADHLATRLHLDVDGAMAVLGASPAPASERAGQVELPLGEASATVDRVP